MTVDNNWVYTDYKGRELVWLPFYRYLVAGILNVFPNMDGLQLAAYLNTFIAVITVGFLSYKVAQVRSKKIAMWAGIILAVLPWHVAYSTMNIPAIFGGLLLLVVVLEVMDGKWYWVAILTMIGVLTRYEITYILIMVGIFTIGTRNWEKSAALLIGACIGLSLWSYWSYINTGNYLFWLTEKSNGLSWDAFFQTVIREDKRTLFDPFLSIIQALPILLIVLIPSWMDPPYKVRKLANLKRFLPLFLILFQLLFLAIGQYFYFSAANPRYFVIVIPLGVYAVFSLIRDPWFNLTYVSITSYCVGFIVLIGQFAAFYYQGQTWEKFSKTGEFINNLESTDNFWIDEPAIIYHASLPLPQVFSSDQIIRDGYNKKEVVRNKLITANIAYIVSFEASYSKTLWIWPEMHENDEFLWEGVKFTPVYRFSVDKAEAENMHESLVKYAQSRFGPVTVWKVMP